jgi:hypothetical protein
MFDRALVGDSHRFKAPVRALIDAARSLGGLEHRGARVVEQEEGIDSVLNSVRGKEISNWKSVADPVGRTGAANGGDGFEIVQGDPCCDVKLGSLGSFLAGLSASAGWFRPDGVGRSRVF